MNNTEQKKDNSKTNETEKKEISIEEIIDGLTRLHLALNTIPITGHVHNGTFYNCMMTLNDIVGALIKLNANKYDSKEE